MEYRQEIKIPKERVAVLIGKKGEVKKKIEKETGTKIEVDSEEGEVIIKSEDNVRAYETRGIVQAIGRGFSPENAELLLNEKNTLEIINIIDFTGKSKKKILRMKGRVIGTSGKAKRLIEQFTNTKISIYGKTISIIGEIDAVANAKRALEGLLKGSTHGNVFMWLERQNSME